VVDLTRVKDYLVFALLLAALYFAGRELGLLDEPHVELPAALAPRTAAPAAPVVADAPLSAPGAQPTDVGASALSAETADATSKAKPKTKPKAKPKATSANGKRASSQLASARLDVEAQPSAGRLRTVAQVGGSASTHPARRVRTPDTVFAARYRGSALNEIELAAHEIEQELLREQTVAFDRCFAAGEYDVQVISTPRGEQQLLRPAPDEPLQRVQAFSEGSATGVRIARLSFAQHPQIYALVDELDWLRRQGRRLALR